MSENNFIETLNKTEKNDEQTWHNPYEQELREQESIQRGDVEALKKCWEESYDGSIGRLADDFLRHMKNLAVAVITLSSRSAIKGGLNAETVFSIVDNAILNIEKMTVPLNVLNAIHDTQLLFTQMVYKNNNSKTFNPIINKAKDYICVHLNSKINVGDIADWLDVNPDYLSNVFHKHENKTITQYILEEKIKLSCNMLKFSDYSIQQISIYLGFCSQSHFTKQFKNHIKLTPAQYRKQFGTKNYQKNVGNVTK